MPTGRVGAMKRTERTGDEKMERGGFNLQKSLPPKLGFEDVSYDGDYDMNRKLKIYSWGLKKNVSDIKVDIIFDLTVFQTKLDPSIDIPSINGLSNEIMISIINFFNF